MQESLFLLTSMTLKLSLAMFFSRFLVERWARIIIWVGTAIYCVWTLILFFFLIFQCGSPKDVLLRAGLGQCLPFSTLFYMAVTWGAYNCLTDWILALLPIWFLTRSQFSATAKISASALMVLAILGSSASIVRTVYTKQLAGKFNSWETLTSFVAWGIIEPGIGIFVACLATYRPLLRVCVERSKTAISSGGRSERNESDRATANSKFNTYDTGFTNFSHDQKTEHHGPPAKVESGIRVEDVERGRL